MATRPISVLKIGNVAGEVGDIVEIGEVLAYGEGDDVTIGAPLVDGAMVTAEVIGVPEPGTAVWRAAERCEVVWAVPRFARLFHRRRVLSAARDARARVRCVTGVNWAIVSGDGVTRPTDGGAGAAG